MNTISFLAARLVLTVLLICPTLASAQSAGRLTAELKPIQLLKPQTDSGRPLMQVLKDRQSSRQFSTKKLPLQVLSNMLWAAFGINRPDDGKRTAPSSSNVQDIDIYVATAKGCYLYDAKAHTLVPVVSDDIRALTGTQDYVGGAPVNLVYVSDFSKLGDRPDEWKYRTARLDTGFISQNVYLFCASEGLATVVRGLIDTETLSKAMKLRNDQRITLAQSVGYPR